MQRNAWAGLQLLAQFQPLLNALDFHMDIKSRILLTWIILSLGALLSYFVLDEIIGLAAILVAYLRPDFKDKNHPINHLAKQNNIWIVLSAIYVVVIACLHLYFMQEIYKGQYNIVLSLLVIFWPFALMVLLLDIKRYGQ